MIRPCETRDHEFIKLFRPLFDECTKPLGKPHVDFGFIVLDHANCKDCDSTIAVEVRR